jgi:hypothetical protein
MSQACAFGDEEQCATNYPLVRITNKASGHVFYSRTHDHTRMAVASPDTVATYFDVPADQEAGPSTLQVVANGIASDPVWVKVTNSPGLFRTQRHAAIPKALHRVIAPVAARTRTPLQRHRF